MKRCYSCFQLYGDSEIFCPFCGRKEIKSAAEPIYLFPGTVLGGRYIIGETVGAGGFGIIYKAWDEKLETVVAIKEFFASRLVTRAYGDKRVIFNQKSMEEFTYRKRRFLTEARTMAQFGSHKNIPNIFEFFEENNTAYIVMELLIGQPLNEYLRSHGGKVDLNIALMITNEVGNALKALHEKGIIHKDVAPDNIYICSGNIVKVMLLDLGAAEIPDSEEDVIDIVLKPGFSPYEQYNDNKGKSIGPWTDVYALGATLYMMLTGIKPDESTNRKQQDIVVPPDKIDMSISKNMSNAIMKAMAIDRHMRFKNTDEFLKAINGRKKVISLAKERKRRRIKRVVGIVAALAVVGVLGLYTNREYDEKKEVKELKRADIEIWFSVKEDSNEEIAMQSVIEDFEKHYPDVHIKYEAIPEEEYEDRLLEAAEKNKLPDLFESTDISNDILKNARDVRNVLSSKQAKESVFLDQYEKYYDDYKKVPLGVIVPVAYVITNGYTFIDYTNPYFSELIEFGSADIAIDKDYEELIVRNFGERKWAEEEDFLDAQQNTVAVLLSSSMVIDEVKQAIPNYQKTYVCMDSDSIICDYTYEWSLGRGNEKQNKAADRLLEWMLGNIYQNTLMISRCNDGQLPINETCFKAKIENGNLSALIDVYENFKFERDE